MIHVNIIKDKEGFIRQFIVQGHAGYAKSGSDIICSAVSVTAYTAVGALEEIAGITDCFVEKDGYMLCSLPPQIPQQKKDAVRVILETTAVGFKQIELAYPKYVSVLEEEV